MIDIARVLSFVMQKGGACKTTNTVFFSQFCAINGEPTLVIDTDPQANTTKALLKTPQALSLADVIMNNTPVSDVIVPSDVTPNLHVIPSNSASARLERFYTLEADSIIFLKDVIADNGLRGKYKWIIIDTPPTISHTTSNALVASDYVLLPLTPSMFTSQGLQEFLTSLRLIQKKPYTSVKLLGAFMNRFGRNALSADLYDEMRKYLIKETFAQVFFNSKIRESVKAEEALIRRIPIFIYARKSLENGVAGDFVALYDEIIQRVEQFDRASIEAEVANV